MTKFYSLVITAYLAAIATTALAAPPSAPEGFKWVVNDTFTDEFEGEALDAEKWYDHHPRWKGRPPARFMPENVSVGDGNLRLTNGTLDEPKGSFRLGGAAVVSKTIGAHYGYYECRLKASDISMSSTFWMSNRGHHYEGLGRVSQELDILETVGGAKRNPDFAYRMNSNTHVWHNGTSKGRANGNKAQLPRAAHEDYNVYGCWWENANVVHFYLNDEHVGTVHVDTSLIPHPFEHPMHINMVTETYDWETPPTDDEINDSSRNTTYIDWVRAYTLAPTEPSLADKEVEQVYDAYRAWKAAKGGSTTQAKLVKISGGHVVLEKENGKTIKIAILMLSKEDRELLNRVKLENNRTSWR